MRRSLAWYKAKGQSVIKDYEHWFHIEEEWEERLFGERSLKNCERLIFHKEQW